MNHKLLKIQAVQDGQLIHSDIVSKYNLSSKDILYLSNGNIRINFVGIVQKGFEVLISIPKHFMNIEDFNLLTYNEQIKYIQIIIESIQKYLIQGYQNKDFDTLNNVTSDFPLEQYFEIYNYFCKYGIYMETKEHLNNNGGNKISWKTTISKSQKIITNKSIIFSPLFYKKKIINETIITDSMISIINYTYMIINNFIKLPNNSIVSDGLIHWNIFDNPIVISNLQEIYHNTFKDIDKNLIKNIILFLNKINKNSYKNFTIKVSNYEKIWEKVVQDYLTKFFYGIDEKNNICFDKNQNNSVSFESPCIKYNTIYENWFLKPDHYYMDEKNKRLYIFDSKYYQQLNELNHKQFVYHILLMNKYKNYKIFDSLIVPYEYETVTENYLNVSNEYLYNDIPITIYLTKLNMIDALKSFIGM